MANSTPIAIIGMGGRFPGEGGSLSEFWQSLCDGKSAWSTVPKTRFNGDAFWSDLQRQNSSVARSGHFLKQDVSKFDANFFSFPKTDVQAMDPQHRLMVEIAYESLENAGIPLGAVSGSKTGVFIGHFTSDYKEMIYRDPENAPRSTVAGACQTSLANRISWMWDLRGPSFSVDTACSSSLVALHLACQSLQMGESDMAIVGGTNLLLNPEMFRYLSNQSFLSPDGRCKSFDESANGYGRGEGCGCLVLRRVDDAISAGDPIRAVIRGTGSNQDGRTKGMTLPSAEAQEALIRETYEKAGVSFQEVGYIEAHGTGTQAGDKAEVEAIGKTITRARGDNDNLLIGSVKSNIGHLEAAAGVASVIKSVFILENGIIPPSINFNSPNPKIRLSENKLHVVRDLQSWPTEGLRRISTNSFGYGGTNAHAILDDAHHYLSARGIQNHQSSSLNATTRRTGGEFDPSAKVWHDDREIGPRLFTWSAQDEEGLKRVAASLGRYVETKISALECGALDGESFLSDLAYTLSERRTPLQWKTYCIAESLEELSLSLKDSARTSLIAKSSRPPRLGFVFTGQGAQWPRMGAELMIYAAFRSSLDAADRYLRNECDCSWSATAELLKNKSTSQLHRAEYSQTLCTVLQVALVDLLRSWNILPTAVAGHSSGEIGAAYALGALTREDAWRTAYWRGVLSSEMKSNYPDLDGSMMAAGLTQEEATEWAAKVTDGEVVVACVNSPSSVTFSGDTSGINQLETMLKQESLFARKLQVDTAYHSPHMQNMAREYYDALADLSPCKPLRNCSMHSSVTGTTIEGPQLDAVNWVRNLTSPVQFSSAIHDMLRPRKGKTRVDTNAIDILVEVGPHGALRGPALQTLKSLGITSIPYESVISRNENAVDTAIALAGSLLVHGVSVDVTKVNRDNLRQYSRVLTDLPAYPWNHLQSYWHESRLEDEYLSRPHAKTSLLPAPGPSFAEGEKLWRGSISLAEESWLGDHKIHGTVLYPAAGYIAMALEAVRQTTSLDAGTTISAYNLRNIRLTAAAAISEDRDTECIVRLKRGTFDKWIEFSVTTSPDGKSLVTNCSGFIAIQLSVGPPDSERQLELQALRAQYDTAKISCKENQNITDFYTNLAANGLIYGPTFACVKEIHSCKASQSHCTIEIPDAGTSHTLNTSDRPHIIFPGTLDAIFHLAFAAIQGSGGKLDSAMVPKLIREVTINTGVPWKPGTRISGFSNAQRPGITNLHADIVMMNEDNTWPCVEVKGFECAAVPGADSSVSNVSDILPVASKVVWRPEVKLLQKDELGQILTEYQDSEIIAEYLKLLHHSNPDLSVLEVIPKSRSISRYSPVLKREDMKSLLLTVSNATIACSDLAEVKLLEEQNDGELGIALEMFDFNAPDMPTTLRDHKYDVIIVSDFDTFVPNIEVLAQHLIKILKESGKICGLASNSVAVNLNTFFDQRLSYISTSLDGKSASKSKNFWLTEKSASNHINGKTDVAQTPLILLHASDLSPSGREFLLLLSDVLTLQGHTVSFLAWGIDDLDVRNKECISLLEFETPFLEHLSAIDFKSIKSLILEVKSLFWVTGFHGPAASMVDGLARVLRNEMPGFVFRTLHAKTGEEASRFADLIGRAFASSAADDEFLLNAGTLHTTRIMEDRGLNEDIYSLLSPTGAKRLTKMTTLHSAPFPLKLASKALGNLDDLCMEADESIDTTLLPREVEIQVKATALSLKDTLIASGNLPNSGLGNEAAGIVRRVGAEVHSFKPGDRVAVYGIGAHRTLHRSPVEYCSPIPAHVPFEHAANMVYSYGTAWNALIRLANIKEGQSILIRSASNGIGRAATHVAKHYGLKIFATVGSDFEYLQLRNEEDLPPDHIFNETGTNFVRGIQRLTAGKGVDVVLNCLPIQAPREIGSCVADFGYFIEFGDARSFISDETRASNLTHASFDLDSIASERPEVMASVVRGASTFVMKHNIAATPTTSFPISDVVQAMRHVQSGKAPSPSVLTWGMEDLIPLLEQRQTSPTLESDKVYLLVGGLGGLGRSLASKLVQLGARKLAFLSRSGAASASAKSILNELSLQGVQVKSYQGDVANAESLAVAIAQCSAELGEIRGVFQCAMVLRDVLFSNMTYEQWSQSTLPKVQGSWNLHKQLPDVEFFITLSSFSAIFGNPGQSNYAAGGAYEDALAHYRRSRGLHAVTLDLGIMRDVGVLAETGITESLREWEEPYGIREPVFHALLELAIAGDLSGQLSPQIVTGLATAGSALKAGIAAPFYMDKPQFAIMARTGIHNQQSVGTGNAVPISTLISESKSLEEAASHVTQALVTMVSKLLDAPVSEIDTSRFLHSFGIDSLNAIRIVTWALKDLSSTITVFDVLASVPLLVVASKIASRSAVLPKELVPS